jgi:hypothetical protein
LLSWIYLDVQMHRVLIHVEQPADGEMRPGNRRRMER